MKKNIIANVLVGLLCTVTLESKKQQFSTELERIYKGAEPWIYVDFDTSMKLAEYPQSISRDLHLELIGISGPDLYDFFKEQYERQSYNIIELLTELRVPKIIHQIWIGHGVPQELKKFQ